MPDFDDEDGTIYGISSIDFDRLRQKFQRSPKTNTQIRELRDLFEQRLAAMIAWKPLRIISSSAMKSW